jgi:hypothetical protein
MPSDASTERPIPPGLVAPSVVEVGQQPKVTDLDALPVATDLVIDGHAGRYLSIQVPPDHKMAESDHSLASLTPPDLSVAMRACRVARDEAPRPYVSVSPVDRSFVYSLRNLHV